MQITDALLKIGGNCFAIGIHNAPGLIALRCGDFGLAAKLDGGDAVYIQCEHDRLL